MNIYFITGASKGIGYELCRQLIANNNIIIAVARTKNEQLIKLAEKENCQLKFIQFDLANHNKINELIEVMVDYVDEKVKTITLINNAGVIAPIGQTENNKPEDIARSIAVNLTAPIVLSSTFIKELAHLQIDKKIINISSGAGRKVYHGWSSYCTTKAGLDHYTRVVAAEQKDVPFGVKLISIAPGIIDTQMQEIIRSSQKDDFKHLEQFITYKNKGLLSTPHDTAKKLINVIQSDQFDNLDPVIDLRNL